MIVRENKLHLREYINYRLLSVNYSVGNLIRLISFNRLSEGTFGQNLIVTTPFPNRA